MCTAVRMPPRLSPLVCGGLCQIEQVIKDIYTSKAPALQRHALRLKLETLSVTLSVCVGTTAAGCAADAPSPRDADGNR